jgi:hypothetical protein
MIILAGELAGEAAKVVTEVGGLQGSIIGTLMGVITILAGVIVWMQRRADKVYGYRLTERDTLKDALHESAAAADAQASATKERNQMMDELSSAIGEQTIAMTQLVERLTMQHGHLVQDQDRTGAVISSIAEAMRNAALTTSGVKQSLDQLLMGIPGVTKEIKEHIDKLIDELQREAQSNRRSR